MTVGTCDLQSFVAEMPWLPPVLDEYWNPQFVVQPVQSLLVTFDSHLLD